MQNDRVETDFRQVNVNCFEVRAFVGSEERALIGIWLRDRDRFGAGGIYFSSGSVGNSWNAWMSVSGDGYTIFLDPFDMARRGRSENALTMEEAAEYFWSLFVERLR